MPVLTSCLGSIFASQLCLMAFSEGKDRMHMAELKEKDKESCWSNFPTRTTYEAPLVLWSALWDLSVGSLQGCCNLPGPINITFRSREALSQQYEKQRGENEQQNVKLIKILYPIRLPKQSEPSPGLEAAARRSDFSLHLMI